jgi:hypothetical protein
MRAEIKPDNNDTACVTADLANWGFNTNLSLQLSHKLTKFNPIYKTKITVLNPPSDRSTRHFTYIFLTFLSFKRSQNYKERLISLMSVNLYVYPYGKNLLPLDTFSWNLVFEYSSKIRLENPAKLREEQYTFIFTSCSFLPRMRCSKQKMKRNSKHTFYVQ